MARLAPRLALASLALAFIAAQMACQAREPSSAKVQAEPTPATEQRPTLVTVELALVDDEARERLAARLGPDSPLAGAEALLAVVHHIEDGWHIYWQNPGDSGLRTRIEVEAEHAEAGPVLYPAPDRFTAAGGQVTYGWGHEAVLFVPLRNLSHELGADARIELRSHYLACAESCIPGDAKLEASVDQLRPRDDELTRAMLDRIPEPAAGRVSAGWTDGALALRPNPQAGEDLRLSEFFPYATDTAMLGKQQPTDAGLVLHYRFSGSPPEGAQGVLRAQIDGQVRWLELAVPWPPAR